MSSYFFSEETRKFVAGCVAAVCIAFFVLLMVLAVNVTREHTRVGEARARACQHSHNVALCLKVNR